MSTGRLAAWRLAGMLAAAFLVGGASSVSAQTLWDKPYRTDQASVEWISPVFKERPAIATGAAFLNLSYALTDWIELIGELPLAYAPDGGAAFGNPYVGVGLNATSFPLLLEVGVRSPLAGENVAVSSAAFADIGRSSGFRPNELSASVLASWRMLLTRRASIRVRGGAVGAQFPDTTGRATQEVRFRYSAQLWYEGDLFLLGLTATGRATPAIRGSLQDETAHHVAGSLLLDLSPVQPGIMVGVPVDEAVRKVAPFWVGLSVAVDLSHY